MDLLDALLDTEVFSSFRREELEPLAPSLRRRTYPPGVYLWHTGDPVVAFCLVIDGLVKARQLEANGSELVVQLVGPGETTGEFHVFDDSAVRYYDTIAVERSEVLVVPRDHLVFLLEQDARLAMKLAAAMLRRLLRLHGGLADIQLVDLEARLARRILELVKTRGERSGHSNRIDIRLRQSLLASTARASRENTNRALKRLSDDGVVELSDGYLVVCDHEALVRRANL